MIVVDANIAAKWYLPETDSAAAVALQESHDQLAAPDLIRMEVAASITRRVRAEKKEDRLPADLAVSRCAQWFGLLDEGAIALIPEGELLNSAVTLSAQLKHALQDCLYLAAASLLGVPLITADGKFQEKAVHHYPETHLLSKWRMN